MKSVADSFSYNGFAFATVNLFSLPLNINSILWDLYTIWSLCVNKLFFSTWKVDLYM